MKANLSSNTWKSNVRRAGRLVLSLALSAVLVNAHGKVPNRQSAEGSVRVNYRTVDIEGLSIFYREAGDPKNPTLLLLHGFPTSSHMFRDLIPLLADKYHVVAPDYPGFGQSSAPDVDKFDYSFAHLSNLVEQLTQRLGLAKFSIYVQDYGAPIGFRLASAHPEQIQAIISQNGNAYEEGLTSFWKPMQDALWKRRNADTEKPLYESLTLDATKSQYLAGVRDPAHVSPDAWIEAQAGLDRPGNKAIQMQLFYDYRTNVQSYPAWHEYFRKYQPPTLLVWGKNDPIFGPDGAKAFKQDLKSAELHLLNTGHFALEEDSREIAGYIRAFLAKSLR
jgi:pimeloyl-ACP methyl ester carboxylesterase